jgi:cystathionine beta-synthase
MDVMQTATSASPATEIKDSILDAVGHTPLVRVSRLAAGLVPQVLVKVEALNPGGSIKDRAALSMIAAAERSGALQPGGTIVEPTSGNTGTGLAIVARLKGYRVIAVMPDKMSREKIDLLRAYGAEVVICPTNVDPEDAESYYSVSDRLASEIPGAFKPNQYFNPANPAAHYATTGPEIWEQTGGRITHLVAGVGTGGTVSGVARYLKERNPAIVVVGADPVGSIYASDDVRPYLVEGVGEDFWPETFDRTLVDRWIRVSDRDSFVAARRLAESEGILAGGSSGTAMHAALQLAAELDDPAAMIVTILPDGGRSYLSKVYNDAWMTEHGFLARGGAATVGDVLRLKHGLGEVPPLVSVGAHQRVRDAVALLHEHRVSQLPVVSAHDPRTIVGSVAERGLLKHAVEDAGLLDAPVARVMEAPLAAVAVSDPVADAVSALVGERQALLVLDGGVPVGVVTGADVLEAVAS